MKAADKLGSDNLSADWLILKFSAPWPPLALGINIIRTAVSTSRFLVCQIILL